MDKSNKRFLLEPEGISMLASHGISYPKYGVAGNIDEAVEIAERIGFPVVLKVVSAQIVHKSDMGGVITGITDREELVWAYINIFKKVTKYVSRFDIEGVLVCRQADPGWEFVIGGMHDEIFGPTIMFGLGGIYIEVFKDVSFRVCPITEKDAWEMVREIKGYELLKGVRGKSALDLHALVELLIKTSSMLINNKCIKELDLNPVRVYEKGVMVLDARIMKES